MKSRRSCLVVVAVVAVAVRLASLVLSSGLMGVYGYDEGVYVTAALEALHGHLPYRDVLLLHPPGVVLVLMPFAALARWTGDPAAWALARLAFIVVGAGNAALVAALGWRVSARTGWTAGCLYALWAPAAYSERTTLLEPIVTLGPLVALTVLTSAGRPSRRRSALAGAALGLAVSVKLWAAAPAVVVLAWCLRRWGWRRAALACAATATVLLVVCLPFALAAGSAMARMVVSDQLHRPKTGVPAVDRLASMAGTSVSPDPATTTGTLAAGALVMALVLASAVAACRARVPVLPLAAVLLAVEAAVLLATPSYFGHYATFAAAPICLLLGWGSAQVAQVLRAPLLRHGTAVVAAGAAVVLLVAMPDGQPRPTADVRRDLAQLRCVRGDSVAVLLTADVVSHDLDRGCSLLVDITGYTYDVDRPDLSAGPAARARRHNELWQRRVRDYIHGSDAYVTTQLKFLSPETLAELHRMRLRDWEPEHQVWVR